jgi:hypothetical protein
MPIYWIKPDSRPAGAKFDGRRMHARLDRGSVGTAPLSCSSCSISSISTPKISAHGR